MSLETQSIYAAGPHTFKGEKNMDFKTNTNETYNQPSSNPEPATVCMPLSQPG